MRMTVFGMESTRRMQLTLAMFTLNMLLAAAHADDFPEIYDSEKGNAKPMAPAGAAQGFRMPEGFHVNVFAAEPAVRNPIAAAWDGRGRLWVAENYTYAER